jgi:NDP-sugar pyrophosphorylase family protein
MFTVADLLDLQQTEHVALFEKTEFVWEALAQIKPYLQFRLKPEVQAELIGKPFISGQVFIGKGTVVEPGAVIKGPAWIGADCQIRSGAYIRENVIVGNGCILGNSSEFKNSILFNGVQAPHFNYVGDSIIGAKAHLAAGVILSNLKLHDSPVTVRHEGRVLATGLRKFGAVVGDGAEIGCHAVLSPGSIIGRNSLIYPGVQWRGVLPENSIVKLAQSQVVVKRTKKS